MHSSTCEYVHVTSPYSRLCTLTIWGSGATGARFSATGCTSGGCHCTPKVCALPPVVFGLLFALATVCVHEAPCHGLVALLPSHHPVSTHTGYSWLVSPSDPLSLSGVNFSFSHCMLSSCWILGMQATA